jgi:hypothetical protein
MANKAHAAVVRRLFERYGAGKPSANGFDVHFDDLIIEVETSATLSGGLERLRDVSGRRFLAVTNREALEEAMALTESTGIGVMDPWGDVVRGPSVEIPA